ncbi:carbohydrate ABC transporter permease [Chelatococcus composti]|uniref:Multiple sugar transport system permease protein n=1 Tax=Chelatococcus composti TaxID=1743235 RepID=A0A841KGA5_9HYPH|nr:sugar ABC transporter permease [Chelatococcus composti]MBB6168936.1 multiple sugar transport system permease protein [Chelatococcus composti]MBS7737538.1 sugar ABC transporter permease [Chelatococcus composti]GGG44086.1 ABC transporter permease [Chelatococcus composti]
MAAVSISAMQEPRRALPYVAPALALLAAVILVPAVYVLWLSFQQSTFGRAATFVGFANYAKILADPYFWRALGNTVVVVLVVVHVEVVLGLAMAMLFVAGLPFRKLLIAAVLAPYAVSEVGAVVMWRTLFDPDTGFMTRVLTGLGLPPLEWSVVPSHGLALVALLSIWLHLPFTFIILYAARLAIPKELYEAAEIDGATPWQSFRRITLPLLMPAILVAMLFRYIFAYRLFSEVWLLTQGGPARSTEVVAVYLYLEAFRYNDFGAASATGWLMVVTSLMLAAFYLRRLYREMFARAD